MDNKPPVIVWFRQDLRLSDNPALSAACATGQPVLPIYILDDKNAGDWAMGGASRVWLYHSLTALKKSLPSLLFFKGNPLDILPALVSETNATKIFWNRCYEPWRITRDKTIKETLSIPCESFNASLLWEPWDIKKSDGTPYRVFTPFFRKGCLGGESPRVPLPAPKDIRAYSQPVSGNFPLESLNLLPAPRDGIHK